MDDDLLKMMMEAIDPARDLTDEALEELVPHARLMEKIAAGVSVDTGTRRTVNRPFWRRAPALIVAGTAAATLVISGAVTLLGSAPVVLQTSSFGPVHKGVANGPMMSGSQLLASSSKSTLSGAVKNHRFVHTVRLDGGAFSVSPAPASMTTPSNRIATAREIWATSQLQGYSKQPTSGSKSDLGYGIVTITKHVAGVPTVTKVAAWVGLAYDNSSYFCPMEKTGQSIQQLMARAPSNGLAAVVAGQPSGSPAVVYIAKSVRCDRLYPSQLANAAEEFSLPWSVLGKVSASKIAINVSPPPCGGIVGNAMATSTRSGFLSSVTITEYGTAPEYTARYQSCPAALPTREVIDLRGSMNAATKFIHPGPGPIKTVATTSK